MTDCDVLVVGSGPCGTAFARRVGELVPHATVLVVDAGPDLDVTAAANTRDLRGPERAPVLDACRGPDRAPSGPASATIAAAPGTFLLRLPDAGTDDQVDMPAAALSRNVGGMGAHWACACPAPAGPERLTELDDATFDHAFARAARWLSVTDEGFPPSALVDKASQALADMRDPRVAPRRMPLACRVTGGPPRSTGTADVLAPLLADPRVDVEVRSETACRHLRVRHGRVVGAELVDLRSDSVAEVSARVVVVAADALFSPALLWASGIRPPALGRGLNDQPMVSALTTVAPELAGTEIGTGPIDPESALDHVLGVTWLPFDAEHHPFHGQVTFLDQSYTSNTIPSASAILGWFLPKDVRPADRLIFGEPDPDHLGLPRVTIHHRLTEVDRARAAAATSVVTECARALAMSDPDMPPALLPSGHSLHYQGTVRMGARDDGRSVCDTHSRVWGLENLYVAGNGVIPTQLACNPTATSMALAIIAAEHAVS